jgi:hypothetical protein
MGDNGLSELQTLPPQRQFTIMKATKLMAACTLAVLASACSQAQSPVAAANATAKILVIQSGG